MILIDSNILIDVIESDPVWQAWSMAQIEDAGAKEILIINQIVLAETAPRSGPLADFCQTLDNMMIRVEALSNEGAYIAGAAFQKYRHKRLVESPRSILADFLIGGHAQALGATILTRDPRFYKAYFPTVPLIAPTKDDND